MENSATFYHDVKKSGVQVRERNSSSTDDVSVNGGTSSQEQCLSSDSGQYENYEKDLEIHEKQIIVMNASNNVFNPSQIDYNNNQMIHFSYPYADPHFSGFMPAYGPPHTIFQHQKMRIATARVPLPPDFAENGPIYVNAKQYYGILRRRQSRAKLEAQNKLVKSRKPYLHESRHVHALNRVRGTGGRFLSTKKLEESNSGTITFSGQLSNTVHLNRRENISELDVNQAFSGEVTSFSSNGVIFRPSDGRFSDSVARIGELGGGGTQQHRGAPVVR